MSDAHYNIILSKFRNVSIQENTLFVSKHIAQLRVEAAFTISEISAQPQRPDVRTKFARSFPDSSKDWRPQPLSKQKSFLRSQR